MKFLYAFAILAIVLTAVYGQTDPWNDYKVNKHSIHFRIKTKREE